MSASIALPSFLELLEEMFMSWPSDLRSENCHIDSKGLSPAVEVLSPMSL